MKADEKFAKGFEWFTESVFWLQLAFSPILASIIIGALISAAIDGIFGYILWGIIIFAGVIGGIFLAEFARKKKGGAAHFASRIMATPELDKVPEKYRNDNLKPKHFSAKAYM